MRPRTQLPSAGVVAATLLALVLGAASAFLTTGSAVAAGTCERKACDTANNYCSNVDLDYNCGTPCKSVACEEIEA